MLEQEATRIRDQRHPLQTVAAAIGVVFLLVGVLGFVPATTTHHDELAGAGHHSGALLLGTFSVSILHNLVHLTFGVAGLALSTSVRWARVYLLLGGVVYAVLWLYGLVVNFASVMNFVPVNTADNWLHLGLAVVMIGSSVLLGRGLNSNGLPRQPPA